MSGAATAHALLITGAVGVTAILDAAQVEDMTVRVEGTGAEAAAAVLEAAGFSST